MYSMDNDIDHILVSEDALKAKVNELGAQISRDYAGKDLLLVSILKGSVVFMADLMRAVQIPCAIDFMVVSSYGGANTSSTGLVKIIKDLDADLTGKDVLIVEDILDTGITLSKLVPVLKMRNPSSVKICTILSILILRNKIFPTAIVGVVLRPSHLHEMAVGCGKGVGGIHKLWHLVGGNVEQALKHARHLFL